MKRERLVVTVWAVLAAIMWAQPVPAQTWQVRQRGTVLEVFYGSGSSFPQYAVLHLDSGYFRMVHLPYWGWSTSVILMPAFWSQGRYYQGAPVTATWRADGKDLLLFVSGNIGGLQVSLEVRLSPPAGYGLTARVRTTSVTGNVALDNRPGEAFKTVMLSSMRVSSTQWDARAGMYRRACITYHLAAG